MGALPAISPSTLRRHRRQGRLCPLQILLQQPSLLLAARTCSRCQPYHCLHCMTTIAVGAVAVSAVADVSSLGTV